MSTDQDDDKPNTQDAVSEMIASLEQHLSSMTELEQCLEEGLEFSAVDEAVLEEYLQLFEELEGDDAERASIIEDEFTELARSLRPGAHIELSGEDGPQRVKLAWRSDEFDEFTFANWRRQIVEEKNLEQLAHLLREEQARVIQRSPLLARLLGAMIRRIRRKRQHRSL